MNLPSGKFNVILADPPWQFKNYSDEWHKNADNSKWVGKHYSTMTIQDIQDMNIASITDKNAVCLMWVTFPMLDKGIETLKKWGFEYKTVAFTWVKLNKKTPSLFWGMGYYTRSNAEICLLGTKGKPLTRHSKSVHQVIQSPIEKHSKKPDEVRERIVELFGDVPRVELFARQKTDGWVVWGNEV